MSYAQFSILSHALPSRACDQPTYRAVRFAPAKMILRTGPRLKYAPQCTLNKAYTYPMQRPLNSNLTWVISLSGSRYRAHLGDFCGLSGSVLICYDLID